MSIKYHLNKLLKKVTSVISIFAIITATSVGFSNSANAADGDTVSLADDGTVDSDTALIAQSTLLLLNAEADTATFTIDATTPFAIDVLSFFEDGVTVSANATVSGTLTIDESITAVAQTDANVLTLIAANEANIILSGNIVEGDDANINITLTGPTGTLTLNGATAQAIAAKINTDSTDNDGILVLSGAGTKTFSDAVGGINELGSVSVAAESTAVFNGALNSVAVNNLGTLTLNAASTANTITNSGTLSINQNIDSTAAGLASIIMHTQDSVLNFNSAATRDLDMVITATTNGFGTINVVDTSGEAAAAAQVLSGGDIGTDAARIGTLNVGSATANGALTTIAGDAIFVNNLNIIGGDHADEDSILTAAANVTSTNGITLTKGLGDARLLTTAAATIAGTIDGAGTGDGSSIISSTGAQTTVFSNNIGSTGAIDSIVINQATADFDGNVTATTMSLAHATGTALFSGATEQTFTGNITATNGQGTLTGSNATGLTVTGTVGAEDARLLEVIASDDSANTFQGAINAITFDIDSNSAAEFVSVTAGNIIGTDDNNAGALEIAAGAVLRLDPGVVAGTTVFNLIEATAGATGVVIDNDITIRPSAQFNTGTVVLIDGDTAMVATTELADILITNNALTSYAVVDGAVPTHDVNITATAKSDAVTSAELSTTINAAKGLRAASTATGTAFATDRAAAIALDNAVNAFAGLSATADSEFANQVSVQDDLVTGSTFATKAMTGTVQGIVANRMASLRSGDAYVSGVATGNHMSANSMFLQAFGSMSEQDNKTVGSGTQFGYEADTAGLAIGADGLLSNGSVLGLSLSMSNTDVDGKGTGRAKNDIDSYTASLYMDKATAAGYIEGSLTYGINENSSSRIINTAGLNRTYSADYDSDQISLKIGGGIPNDIGDNTFITPFASLTATKISTDAYTEKSTTANDSLRLRVAQDDVDSFVGTIGIKAHKVTDQGTPMISLAINNEFGDSTISSTNTYQGGGTAFNTSTDVEELSATLALGYKFGSDKLSFTLGYEATANDDDYLSHYGTAKLVSKF